MNNTPSIKQGQSFGITITLDEDLNGRDFYLGFYHQASSEKKASILLGTNDNTLFQIGDKTYQANISYEDTKKLNIGGYKIEALIKNENDQFVSISNNTLILRVEPSNIGKEI